ncbi:MAG: hypothetical protein LBD68_00960 [Zoogloeaceae bacterium]|jgi:hypothetical protein|nr:hypothetical protein [Zoogloeaceae bacterium]
MVRVVFMRLKSCSFVKHRYESVLYTITARKCKRKQRNQEKNCRMWKKSEKRLPSGASERRTKRPRGAFADNRALEKN